MGRSLSSNRMAVIVMAVTFILLFFQLNARSRLKSEIGPAQVPDKVVESRIVPLVQADAASSVVGAREATVTKDTWGGFAPIEDLDHRDIIVLGYHRYNYTRYTLAPTSPGVWGTDPVPLCVRSEYESEKGESLLDCLPSYLILGVLKGGTSSVYDYLNKHPQVFPAMRKELCWFRNVPPSMNPPQVSVYRDMFKPIPPDSGGITGEACPFYIVKDEIPILVSQMLPHVRLITLLRDPTDRLFSMFNMRVRYRNDGFKGAERIEKFVTCDRDHEGLMQCTSEHLGTRLYLEQGKYAEQIRRWFSYIPRSPQYIFIQSEQLYAHEIEMMMELEGHLGLSPFFTAATELKAKNQAPPEKKVAWMDLKLKAQIQEYYSRYNKELYELLGVEWNWEAGHGAVPLLDHHATHPSSPPPPPPPPQPQQQQQQQQQQSQLSAPLPPSLIQPQAQPLPPSPPPSSPPRELSPSDS